MDRNELTEHSAASGEIPIPVIREHIVATPDTCGGKPRIAGSRIQVKHVARMHDRQGMTPSEIVSAYPHLTLADVHAALTFYHDHREQINAEINADRKWYEEMKASSLSLVREKLSRWTADGRDDPLPPE
jgi:uncharacterized protein (DUF433 family)